MVTPTDDGGYKLTKREFTKLAAGGSIVMQSDDGGWLSGILSDDEDTSGPEELTLTVRDNGEIVSEEVSEINAAGNLNARLVETENDIGPIIELSAVGDGGGAFEDTDGDGVAELQQDHADLQGGDLRNAGMVDADEVESGSLPTRVRLFLDANGDAVGIARDGTKLGPDSNHATVIQSAIDHVFQDADFSGWAHKRRPNGYIDGGEETFTLTGNVQVKDQVGLKHMKLDAAGNTGFVPLTIAPTSTRKWAYGQHLHNVSVIGAGDSDGIKVTQGGWAPRLTEVYSYDHAGRGLLLEGCVGAEVKDSFCVNNSGSEQAKVTDTSNEKGNYNKFIGCNFRGASSTSGTGLLITQESDTSTPTKANVVKRCNFGNVDVGLQLGNKAVATWVDENWFETGDIGTTDLLVHGPTARAKRNVLMRNRVKQVKVDNANINFLLWNIAGEGSKNVNVECTSNALETVIRQNWVLSLTDNGTRTVVNNMGTNAGDPNTTGDWNITLGDSRQGLHVYDTTNNAMYAAVNGSWVAT